MKISAAIAVLGLSALALSAVAATPSVTGKIVGADGGWDYATFDPVHRRLYVSRSDGVMALDVDTGKVTAKLVDLQRTHIALPVNGGSEILVTSTTLGGVVIADALTGVVRASLKTGEKPDAALLEPTTGQAWVMDNKGGGITLIDVKAGTKLANIAVPGALESAATDGKGRVFVNVEDLAEIAVVDVKARRVRAHYPLKDCEEPSGLAYAAGRLVSVCANGTARVIEARSGKEIASLPIGPRPDTALYDSANGVVYVPTAGDGKLTVISPATARVVAVVATQTGARTQTQDPKTGTLYLPAANYVIAPGTRPTMVPGSFVLLELKTR